MQSASKNRPLQSPKTLTCCRPKPRRQRHPEGEAEHQEMFVPVEEVLVQQEPQPEQQELLAEALHAGVNLLLCEPGGPALQGF